MGHRLRVSDEDITKAYCFYNNLINQTSVKYEFEYEGYTVQFSPDVCMNTTLKWHIRAKKPNDEFRLVGAVLNLFDVSAILSKKYLDEVFSLQRSQDEKETGIEF